MTTSSSNKKKAKPCFFQLNNRALLKISGKDAKGFLQGQFSNDIDALAADAAQLNAYCQHQGRIIALIWVMRKNDDYFLSFANDLSAIVSQKLTMFKMMLDVSIADVSGTIIQLGVVGGAFDGAFKLNKQQSIALLERVDDIKLADSRLWERLCIENGMAEVYLKTTEKFVPQLLNLDIDEVGVNFSKGCYPGQEVVARLHYLGKSKRRMRLFECDSDVIVGDELIVADSKSTKASGVVVRCVKLDKKSLCLASIELVHENDRITLNNANGSQLRMKK